MTKSAPSIALRWFVWVSIFAGTKGYLDGLKVSDIGRFEAEFLGLMRSSHKDVLDTIRTTGALSDDTQAKLRSILDGLVKSFS